MTRSKLQLLNSVIKLTLNTEHLPTIVQPCVSTVWRYSNNYNINGKEDVNRFRQTASATICTANKESTGSGIHSD